MTYIRSILAHLKRHWHGVIRAARPIDRGALQAIGTNGGHTPVAGARELAGHGEVRRGVRGGRHERLHSQMIAAVDEAHWIDASMI